MTYNSRYLKEYERQWARQGLLTGLRNYSRATTAVMLESCRLWNEGPCPKCGKLHGPKKVDWLKEGF